MRNILTTLLLLSLSPFANANQTFAESITKLKELKTAGEQTIAKAKECLPTVGEDRIDLCAGGAVPSIKAFIALDQAACVKELRAKGYTVADNVEKSAVLPDEIKEFTRSTKRSQTFHDHKTVILRKDLGNKVDCLHELVHVYQWTSDSASELAPKIRRKQAEAIERTLERALEDIEKLERAKKRKDAKKRAAELAPYIAHLKEWNEQTDWLDEKDSHFVIYTLCPKLNCEPTDLEVATTNLSQRKKFLPKSFLTELEKKKE